MHLLELIDLTVSYGKAEILHGVRLAIDREELVALIGPNGAGKTTLMRSVLGLTSLKGIIRCDGVDIQSLLPHEIAKMKIALCPERRRLFPEMTVLRNLEMGAYLRKERTEVQHDLERMFILFPSLEKRKGNKAVTLSGGEQQMLAVARAVMLRPKLLMLDEPSFGLAPMVKKLLIDIFQEIRKGGISVFLSEQDALLALESADRGYVLENGRIVAEGAHDAMMTDPHVKEAYLGL